MRNDIIWIEAVQLNPDISALASKAGIAPNDASQLARFQQIAADGLEIAQPVGFAFMENLSIQSGADVKIGFQNFQSELMGQNMKGLSRAFPYLATEGAALCQWGKTLKDEDAIFGRQIRQFAVKSCEAELERAIMEKYGIRQVSSMNPGSLVQWPLDEQGKLFELFEALPEKLGVSLLPSLFMDPPYSVSGVFFETEKKYWNCQLCPRDSCPNRKAQRLAQA